MARRLRRQAAPATIFDVADQAGVSASTVSRSLRGMPNVASSTRERVERVADELGYVASPAASGLASGRTTTIGVVVPFLSRWYFMRVVDGVEQVLRGAGYDLLLTNLGDAAGRTRFFQRQPFNRKVDGVILVDVALQPDEQSQMQALGVPITVVAGAALGVASVGIDETQSVRMAVQHLAHLGHEQIGMIRAEAEPGPGFEVPDQRRASFLSVVAEAGLETEPEWIVTGEWGLDGAAVATQNLLAARRMPTAIFASSDETAFGALRTLRLAGLEVPRHMSVVGFDDHDMAGVVNLTTIAQPVARIGAAAATMLLDALDGRGDPFARVVVPTRLVVRGSTAPPIRRRRQVLRSAAPAR
ncbi:MAG: LacI family transcriptional regulator [Actinomycetota bacterium]|nr:LacI family transcriptional regulator [Actinomycetota bacterium]